jgi:hypothetical protein
MNKTGSVCVCVCVCVKGMGSSVSVVTNLGTERVGTGASMPSRGRDFYLQNTESAFGDHTATYSRGGERFRRRVPKWSINFEKIVSRAHGSFEEQNNLGLFHKVKFLSPASPPLYYTYTMLKCTLKISHDCSYMFRSTWTIIRETTCKLNLAKVNFVEIISKNTLLNVQQSCGKKCFCNQRIIILCKINH